jgi:hypothetical protein
MSISQCSACHAGGQPQGPSMNQLIIIIIIIIIIIMLPI